MPLPSTHQTHHQFDGDGMEEEADDVVSQVLHELALDTGRQVRGSHEGCVDRSNMPPSIVVV